VTYVVRTLVEDDWAALRAVRMDALAESPSAFGSTLAREQAFSEETWRVRARGTATTRLFIAWWGQTAAGIAGVHDEGDGSLQLVSVWVDPAHRRRGLARELTSAALRLAAEQGFESIRLWVTDGNTAALSLYQSFGFTSTGNRQPLPSNPALEEHELLLLLVPGAGRRGTWKSPDGVML
jgi:ribosomal protein S18 acetylase RimI-like enzyme